MIKCPKCGSENRMHVQATISAPASLEGEFNKSNLRRSDVYITSVNWETADYICVNCGTLIPGYGNYVSRLEKKVKEATNICEKFVNKVNTGRARSKETYKECVDFLNKGEL